MYMLILFIFTDEEFIKIKLRDPAAFEKLYKKYRLDVYNFLLINKVFSFK